MRRYARLAVAATLTLALTACGSTDPADPADPKAGAPTATPTQPKQLTLLQVNRLVSTKLKAAKSVRFTVTGTSAGEDVKATMITSLASGRPQWEMTFTPPPEAGKPSETMQMVILPNAVYLKMSGEEVEPGKPWGKAAVNSKNPIAAIFTRLGGSLKDMADPRQQELAAAAAGRLTATRPEKLNGVDTTRYTITVNMEEAIKKVDLRKYLAGATGQAKQVPGLTAQERAQLNRTANLSEAQLAKLRRNMLKAVKGATTTSDLWVDAQGLPVQQTVNSKIKGAPQNITIAYSDWGKATVTIPPASKVAPFPEA
jgi:hypothetical protein